MTTATDHITLYVNNSQHLHIVVKPYSYRVNFAPTFFPRFSIGDPTGIDQARWRSWIQSRFDEGEGQLIWSSSNATNRYAIGHQVEVGRPALPRNQISYGGFGRLQNLGSDITERNDSIIADIGPSLAPQSTSQAAIVNSMATYFTDQYPTFVVEWSGRPMMWHWKSAWIYTSVIDAEAWDRGASSGYANKLTGLWAKAWQHSDATNATFWVSDAVIFYPPTESSQLYQPSVVVAFDGAVANTNALMFYGSTHTMGLTRSTAYFPRFGTSGAHVTVYDNKLWRSHRGELSYLTPDIVTSSFHFWDDIDFGNRSQPILNLHEFNGRLYMGKSDALWTYDAGRTYRIEDFSSYNDIWNFSHMTTHRGYMYFNVKHMMFRLSTAGTMEQIQTYPVGGIIVDAVSVGDKLYYLTRDPGIRPATQVWVFDPETGGNFRLFSAAQIGLPYWRSPRSLGEAYGMMTIVPMVASVYAAQNTIGRYFSPVMAIDPITPSVQRQAPGYAKDNSYFVTSMLDFGLPNMMKAFNRVNLDYIRQSNRLEQIDVFYVTHLSQYTNLNYSSEARYLRTAPAWPASVDDNLIDGDLETGRTFNFTTTDYGYWVVAVASVSGAREGVGSPRPDILSFRFVGRRAGDPRSYEASSSLPFKLLGYMSDGIGWQDISGHVDLKVTYDGENMIVDATFDPYRQWVLSNETRKTITGTEDSRGLSTWYALETLSDFTNFTACEVMAITTDETIRALTAEWNTLGSITSTTPTQQTRTSLEFPKGTLGKQIMLKFTFKGSEYTRSTIQRYEIEWMPAPQQLRTYNFVVPVAENIEMPNLEVAANATSVVATIFSMAGSGRPYVCKMPWPGTHTINALVSISAPGGVVPSLRDEDFDKSYAELPVQIDEV